MRLRLPEFQAFFSLQNVGWLALSVILAKTLHELGHALACRHFGGECHEMGVLLLVFLPCLYCNVSDAWMFNSRWRRVAVDVAGMYVELVLAAACTFLWWFTVPGWINSICFNLMIVCSLNTLLFNGNPLLRYDGYYLLADLWEIPNLHERSATARTPRLGLVFSDRCAPLCGSIAPGSQRLAGGLCSGVAGLSLVCVVGHCLVLLPGAQTLPIGNVGLLARRPDDCRGLLPSQRRPGMHFLRNPISAGRLHLPRIALAGLLLVLAGFAAWHIPLPQRLHVPA